MQNAYLCGTHILEIITKYPELTDKHIQQLPTTVSKRREQLIYVFSHLQFRDGLPLVGSRSATLGYFLKKKERIASVVLI